jgi:VanZ family protein
MKNSLLIQFVAWFPVILWAYMIFHFSSGTVPIASSTLWQDFAVKKTGHVILFGVLAVLVYRALRINKIDRGNAALLAVVLATSYGASDEFHQMYTQGRESRIRDIFIDGLGASLIISIIYKFYAKLPKKFRAFLLELDIN